MVTRGRGPGERESWRKVKRHKLPVAREINTRDILFSTVTVFNSAV